MRITLRDTSRLLQEACVLCLTIARVGREGRHTDAYATKLRRVYKKARRRAIRRFYLHRALESAA